MRHSTLSLLLTMLASVFGMEHVAACGDKLLLVGRGFAYSRAYAAIHPASVLIYVPTGKARGAGSGLASVLKRAGHDAEVATDRAGLALSLASHRIDLVVANVTDMPDAEAASIAAGGQPVLLPVLFDASDADLAAAVTRYG